MLPEAIQSILYDQSRNAAASDEELSWLRGTKYQGRREKKVQSYKIPGRATEVNTHR